MGNYIYFCLPSLYISVTIDQITMQNLLRKSRSRYSQLKPFLGKDALSTFFLT